MDSNDLAIIGIGITLLITLLGVWRDLKGELKDVRSEVHVLGERVARIEGRLDERDHRAV